MILLLEDDRLSHRLVSKIFSGHEVLIAETCAEAMSLVRRHPLIDLAVVDYQLRGESGATFLAELRRHTYCQDLPVVAYTGSSDREVVMRYVELRAQAFHIKPYRAEALLAELARACAGGRRQRFFENPDRVCQRMHLKPADYAGLLNSGAAMLEADLQQVRRLLLSSQQSRLQELFRNISQRLPQLGVGVVVPLADQAWRELEQTDYQACTQTLGVLDTVVDLVRRRALDLLSLRDSAVGAAEPVPAPSAPVRAPAPSPTTETTPAWLRPLLAQPIGQLGESLRERFPGPLFDERGELLREALDWWRRPAALAWFDSVRRLDGLETADIGSVAAWLDETPRYESTVNLILARSEQVRRSTPAGLGWQGIVERLGVAKALVLAAAGQVGRGPGAGPLAVQGLRVRAAARLLLGFELGRFLRVTNPQRIAAASVAADLGLWTLLVASPASAALLLASGVARGDPTAAERALLGGELGAAAAAWMRAAGLAELYQDAALGAAGQEESEVTLLVLRLADTLAGATLGGDPGLLAVAREELARPAHEIWAGLARAGVRPPVEIDEAVELVFTLARSAAWIAGEIVNPREGA